jgi:mRNA interferase HigB
MNVIAYRTIRAFTKIYPEATDAMREWYNALVGIGPRDFNELRQRFPSVDVAKTKFDEIVFVFDVGGNRYRVIVSIHFVSSTAFIKGVMTHAEYTKWNKGGRSS